MRSQPVTRRAVLGALGAAAVAGCTGGGQPDGRPTGSPAPASTPPTATDDGVLVWSNWPDYLDVQHKAPRHPTLAAFSQESGIQVDYREVINDNAEYVSTIAEGLRSFQPVGTDLMVLTSWMAARLVRDREVRLLEQARIPNAKNLVGALAAPSWDPGRRYSMPWQAGLTGIAYDATKVERSVGSIGELLSRPDLKGRVGLLTEFDDSVGLVALAEGADLTDLATADVDHALDRIAAVQRSGQLRGFYGNDFVPALKHGEIAACLAWSGDVLQAQLANPNIKFVLPEEGMLIWSDDFLVPSGSVHGALAAQLIDWYYRPDVAAQVAAWVNYICPVVGAQEAMAELDPDLALSPLIFPDTAVLDRSFQFPALPAAADSRLRAAFDRLAQA